MISFCMKNLGPCVTCNVLRMGLPWLNPRKFHVHHVVDIYGFLINRYELDSMMFHDCSCAHI